MSGYFDYDSFEKWANKFHQKVKSNQAETILVFILENLGEWVVGETKEKTPVGQYPPWKHVAFVTQDGKVVNFIAKEYRVGGTLRRGWKKTNVVRTGNSFEITIYNNVYYAAWVERGYNRKNRHKQSVGWQKGQFMLELTLQEVKDKIVPLLGDVYRQLLEDFLEW